MNDLIERLTKATGPDRELDARIYCAANGYEFVRFERWNQFAGRLYYKTIASAVVLESDSFPLYTASIDAALTLVPPLWSWRVGNLPSGRGFADLGTQASLQCIEGATPAIALCIASLRARMVQNK